MKPKYFLLLLAFLCLQSAQQLHAGIGKVINGTTITFSQDVAGETTIKVDLNTLGWLDKQEVGELTLQDGIVIAFAPNTGRYNSPIYHETYQGVYLNPNNRLTISGKVVSKVVLNCNGNTGFNHLNASADENTMTISTGSEAYRDHVVIQTIEITYGDGSYKERDHAGECFVYENIEYQIISDAARTCGISNQGGTKNREALENLEVITIPPTIIYDNHQYTVSEIGDNAFWTLDIKKINIPNTITRINYCAFSSCKCLETINLPENLKTLGPAVFMNCKKLSSIDIPNSVSVIDYQTFDGCSDLRYISIPSSITEIGGGAFNGCSSLLSISIPSSVKEIGGGAFSGCSGLSSITIPESVTDISNSLFSGCSNLANIVLPSVTRTIGEYAFHGCISLYKIDIPSSVTSIGKSAFKECTNLKSVYIEDVDSWYGIDFANSSANPLYNSGSLYVHEKLLTRLEISANVQILNNTFSGCINDFESIVSYATTPPAIKGWDFKNYTIPLYVPKGSVLNYKAADVWRNFVIIREISENQDYYLSIKQSHGEVRMKVDNEKPYFCLQIKPDEGWHVHSMTLNDEDVTMEISAEGNYTTPAINANSTLYVVFEKGSSNIGVINKSLMHVTAYQGLISVTRAEVGENISVFTIDGKELQSAETDGHGSISFFLPESQTYIVKGKYKTIKVRL